MKFRSLVVWTQRQIIRLGMKMDRIFLLSPSFFALVGGTTLSLVIDLIKTSLSTPPAQANYALMMFLSISAMTISTGSLLFLSIKLDGIREKFAPADRRQLGIRGEDIHGKRTTWKQLWIAFLSACFFVCLGLAFLALGYFVSRNQGVMDC